MFFSFSFLTDEDEVDGLVEEEEADTEDTFLEGAAAGALAIDELPLATGRVNSSTALGSVC